MEKLKILPLRTTIVTLRLTDSAAREWRQAAAEIGLTVSEMIRRVVTDWIRDTAEKEAKEKKS